MVMVRYTKPSSGAVIDDTSDNDAGSFQNQPVTNNSTVPRVSIEVLSDVAAAGIAIPRFRLTSTLSSGDRLTVKIKFSSAPSGSPEVLAGISSSITAKFNGVVDVAGQPRLVLELGGATVNLPYASGSGSKDLVFSHTVQAGDSDYDGIEMKSVDLNVGTVKFKHTDPIEQIVPALDIPGTFSGPRKVDTSAPRYISGVVDGTRVDLRFNEPPNATPPSATTLAVYLRGYAGFEVIDIANISVDDLHYRDPDGDDLAYTAEMPNAENGTRVALEDGVATVTPVGAGEATLVLTASDGASGVVSITTSIVVAVQVVEESQPAAEPTVDELRIAARRVADGRIEFALQERGSDGSWDDRRLPRARCDPSDPSVIRWMVSSELTVDGWRSSSVCQAA